MITFTTAATIVRDALARYGSHSQCDLYVLLGQLDKRTTLEAFIRAADKAADDLVGV